MIDAYAMYCTWAYERHYAIPSREQWEEWCQRARPIRLMTEPERNAQEIERANREEWYGKF